MNYDTPDAQTATDMIEQLPEKAIRAMRVWLTLSETERSELKKATELFESLAEPERQQLHDIVINVKTGPWGPVCPYCGRN
jgi:hypothetical protein